MKWASALSTATDLGDALDEAADSLHDTLGSASPDLAIVFVSPHYTAAYEELLASLAERINTDALLGCSAGGVVGGGHEVEAARGLSITGAILPGTRIRPLRLDAAQSARVDQVDWRALVGPDTQSYVLLIADPFSCPADAVVSSLDTALPSTVIAGGLASGGSAPNGNALFLDQGVYSDGLVGLSLTGELRMETLVAQGCKPIGQPMFVTRVEENQIIELDGQSPRDLLYATYAGLPAEDQELFRSSLFLGMVMQPDRREYAQGDFLIRNILGFDDESGRLAVGAMPQVNDVVQFQLRDAATSRQDLEALLLRHREQGKAPKGGLLFSCLGRGQGLYGVPDHDSNMVRVLLGPIPLGGFFCNGEIGPVGDATYVHGYTSAFALFRPG